MKFKPNANNTILFLLLFTLLLQVILYREVSFLHTTNITFFIAMIFLLIGLFWASIAIGTFDSIHKQVKNIRKSRKNQETESKDKKSWSAEKMKEGYEFFLKVGATFFFLCMFSLIGFYLFS